MPYRPYPPAASLVLRADKTASYELREAVNSSSLETWGDEFEEGSIEKRRPAGSSAPPRVAASPVSFECRVHSIVRVANEHHGKQVFGPHLVGNSDIVIGRVLGIHIKGEYITGDGVSSSSPSYETDRS